MVDYQKLYTGLFNAVTTALDHMAEDDWGLARKCLENAQIDAEEAYLGQG